MDVETKRKHLTDHARASKEIELVGAAISILESVGDCGVAIRLLKEKQQLQLRRIDTAAEKLGVPRTP